ncbi:MAG TPA: lytic transglycosylase domain-containing protein [Vicinamibacterales bacterium]
MLSRIALTLLILCSAVPARAQIYTWRDANGHLVLSNRRPESPETLSSRSYAVPRAQTVRATRYASAERGRQYDDLIIEHSKRNGVRSDLVRAVMQVESAFNPYAKSPKGAMGLMQLMPATMRQYGVTNAFNPAENVRAGVAYLRDLLDRYDDNEELALAAYNAGPGAVDKHGQTIPPYKETRNYVAQINQMASRPVEMRSSQIYKVVDIVDGQPVVRYTDRKPATGSYELVSR